MNTSPDLFVFCFCFISCTPPLYKIFRCRIKRQICTPIIFFKQDFNRYIAAPTWPLKTAYIHLIIWKKKPDYVPWKKCTEKKSNQLLFQLGTKLNIWHIMTRVDCEWKVWGLVSRMYNPNHITYTQILTWYE